MEPILSMAFSLNANRGAYALLLGSGLSRAASIPTGWEITVDLVEQLAQLEQEDVGADPVAWYVGRFGKQPDYSELLDQLAQTPAERCLLLKRYFEPNEDEREQGLKRPTAAHRAIARLMKDGFIRVVLTTNFDRLLEDALAEIGAPPPTVIGSGHAVDGALPLSHPGSFIVKIHGDYLDVRIKNTVPELSEYDPRMDQLLDRVLDEFGLITCGWSSEWDIALREAFKRCKNRRFSTYWAHLPPLNTPAKDLITLRGANAIEIKGADEFFVELEEKVRAIVESNRIHPLSIQAAISAVKRYVVDEQYKVRLHDLVRDEAESLYLKLDVSSFTTANTPGDSSVYADHIRRYDSCTDRLVAMLIHGCYWGEGIHHRIWLNAIERIAHYSDFNKGYPTFFKLRLYPSFRLFVAAGMAALAGDRPDFLCSLFSRLRVKPTTSSEDESFVVAVNYHTVSDSEHMFKDLFDGRSLKSPLAEHLVSCLREPFREIVPRDEAFDVLFDKFEYLFLLSYAHFAGGSWVPSGRLYYRWNNSVKSGGVKQLNDEILREKSEWPLARLGLFGGSFDNFSLKKSEVDEFMTRIYRERGSW